MAIVPEKTKREDDMGQPLLSLQNECMPCPGPDIIIVDNLFPIP